MTMQARIVLSVLCLALVLPLTQAWAGSITVQVKEADTPLLANYKRDAKVVRLAKAGETFSAFVSSLYNGYFMVVDKETNSFLYLPFSGAEEVRPLPEDLQISGQFPAPSADDLAQWQVMPDDAPYTDGVDMLKYRSKAPGFLRAHNGKSFPAHYSYNESYTPVINGSKLVKDAKRFLGTPYVLGGTTSSGIDCSGLTRVCLSNQGIDVVHRASLQALEGCYVHPDNLRAGDLVFFRDDKTPRYLSHVGIYIGGGKFIHASQSAGKVVIGSLSDRYFKSHYAFARRL